MKNIVLIGMPGSGKSSVGLVLAQRLGAELLDTDALIEAAQGRTITDIFARCGEPFFRDLETDMARQTAAHSACVISTGGGMILRPENMEALKETGVLFFLDRPPEALAGVDHSGRPLMAGGTPRIYALYDQRVGLYRAYADHTIANHQTADHAAEEIISIMRGAETP